MKEKDKKNNKKKKKKKTSQKIKTWKREEKVEKSGVAQVKS
jgi:hypothetical protein